TDMAEGLKMMALEGHGMAFLPESAVMHEVRHKQLARADGGQAGWEATMEIRLYRERPSSARPGKALVARLWDYLSDCLSRGSRNPANPVSSPHSRNTRTLS